MKTLLLVAIHVTLVSLVIRIPYFRLKFLMQWMVIWTGSLFFLFFCFFFLLNNFLYGTKVKSVSEAALNVICSKKCKNLMLTLHVKLALFYLWCRFQNWAWFQWYVWWNGSFITNTTLGKWRFLWWLWL